MPFSICQISPHGQTIRKLPSHSLYQWGVTHCPPVSQNHTQLGKVPEINKKQRLGDKRKEVLLLLGIHSGDQGKISLGASSPLGDVSLGLFCGTSTPSSMIFHVMNKKLIKYKVSVCQRFK